MTSRIFYIACIIVLYFTASCKKDYPSDPQVNTPVFYFNGYINGTLTKIEAGVNDYYMYSSYLQDTNNVYGFIGTLKKTNTSKNSIQIKINNDRVSATNSSVTIDSALMLRYYPIKIPGGAPSGYTINFYSHAFAGNPGWNCSWDFGDGTSSTIKNPVHMYTYAGQYPIHLTMQYNGGCVNNIYNTVRVSNPNTGCAVNIIGNTIIYQGDSTVLRASSIYPNSSISYLWSTGEGSDTIEVKPSVTTNYNVSIGGGGCSDTAYITVTVLPASQTCKSYFDFSVDTIGIHNPFALSNITITWTDDAGNVYTSNNSLQPNDSYFQVVSIDDYSKNELGQLTKKMRVKFKCRVYNGTNYVQLDNAEAVIAIAYK